jgi:hypothetical protein
MLQYHRTKRTAGYYHIQPAPIIEQIFGSPVFWKRNLSYFFIEQPGRRAADYIKKDKFTLGTTINNNNTTIGQHNRTTLELKQQSVGLDINTVAQLNLTPYKTNHHTVPPLPKKKPTNSPPRERRRPR